MPFEPEADERKVAAYVGLPPDQRFDVARFPIPCDQLPDGQGYVLVHWGIRVERDLTADGPPSAWPSMTGRPIVGIEWIEGEDGARTPRPVGGEPVTYQLWLVQCYRPGHPLAAERRWHPDLGVIDSITGLTETHTRNDVFAAWRGHALIAARQHDEARTQEEIKRAFYLRQAVDAARRLLAENVYPTFPLIADAVAEDEPGLEHETLKKRWDRRKPPITMGEVINAAGAA